MAAAERLAAIGEDDGAWRGQAPAVLGAVVEHPADHRADRRAGVAALGDRAVGPGLAVRLAGGVERRGGGEPRPAKLEADGRGLRGNGHWAWPLNGNGCQRRQITGRTIAQETP